MALSLPPPFICSRGLVSTVGQITPHKSQAICPENVFSFLPKPLLSDSSLLSGRRTLRKLRREKEGALGTNQKRHASRGGVVRTRAAVADVTTEQVTSPLLKADVPEFVKEAVRDQPWKGLLEPSQVCVLTVDPSRVKGRIPDDLRGTYFRLGPGNMRIGERKQGHWFDGDGMIHSITFDGPDSSVKFQSRWVDTPRIRQRLSAPPNTVAGKGVWTPADGGPLANLGSPENPSNTAPHVFKGQLYALAEGGAPVALEADTLETKGKDTSFVGDFPFSAHPKVDPATGEMYNHGVGPELSPSVLGLSLFKLSPEGKLLKKTQVSLEDATFVHDLAISENYMITIIPPWYISKPDFVQFALGLNVLGEQYKWMAERGTRVVIARKSDMEVVADVKLPAFSTYHHANAYEEDGKLHILTCRLNGDRAKLEGVMGDLWKGNWSWDILTSLWDYTFDTKTWELLSEGPAAKRPDGSVAAAHGHDFPTVHPEYVGRKARYVYVLANDICGRLEGSGENGVTAKVPGSEQPGVHGFYNSLEKYDLETGEVSEYSMGRAGSDAVFVPRDGGSKEDDGYLMALAYNPDSHTSSVVVLDAGSMDLVCEVDLPVHVTTTFHGCWMPKA